MHRKLKFWIVVLLIFVIYELRKDKPGVMIDSLNNERFDSDPPKVDILKNKRKVSLLEAVKQNAEENFILVALVDYAFLDMALNFHETSLEPHHIHNYLFLSTSEKCCEEMSKKQINCYTYIDDEVGKNASKYHSVDFSIKMHYRAAMIIEILEAGFTVLVSDIDIMYLKNPFDFIDCDKECEIRSLMDDANYNAGFIFIRPTSKTIKLYKTITSKIGNQTKTGDQYYLNTLLWKMAQRNESVDVGGLPMDQFMCGKFYFNGSEFAGDKSCPGCVVIHNNFIIGKWNKVYRAKEHHFWVYDRGGYYSSPNAKYLTYDNPVCGEHEKDLKYSEIIALKNALIFAKILNRILILPKFNCRYGPCNLLKRVKLNIFDELFYNVYREHSFLTHPKVPKEIKKGLSGVYKIKDENVNSASCLNSSFKGQIYLELNHSLTDVNILEVFGKIEIPVIQFYSMYGTFGGFGSMSIRESVMKLVNNSSWY